MNDPILEQIINELKPWIAGIIERSITENLSQIAPANNSDNWITIREAAALSGVSHSTVYRLIRSGKIPSACYSSALGSLRINENAFQDWIKNGISKDS